MIATPAPPPLCPKLVAATKKELAAAESKYLEAGESIGSHLVGTCFDTAKGAWLVAMPELPWKPAGESRGLPYAVEGLFGIVFQPQVGPAVRFQPKETLSNSGVRTPKPPVIYDYDHDGVPELFVQVDEEGDEGHRAQLILLLTYRGGAIAPYAPAEKLDFVGMRDVDRDGAPDLLVLAGYARTSESCASGFPMGHPTSHFVAHALADGTFARDDAVAKAEVKSWCPTPPKLLGSELDAICLRVWSTDVAADRLRVAKSCNDWSCEKEMAGQPQAKGATFDCEDRRAYFDLVPPLTLP